MKTAIELISDERKRQTEVEKFTLNHDDGYPCEELSLAAACYALPANRREYRFNWVPLLWPWDNGWWKPTPDDRIRELVKAGALIVAEIERLQRINEH